VRLLLITLSLACCAASEPATFCTTPCGLSVAAENRKPQFACDDYVRVESALVAEVPSLPVCRALRGSVAWELPGFTSVLGSRKVSGWTECNLSRFMFHTGDGFIYEDRDPAFLRRGWNTAFAHEALHLAQGCRAPLPVDEGWDEGHANWVRDGLFDAVERANEGAAWKP
jgi:hypothetical protein